ncbi:magnesium transporter [Propioniferax innocua]|uniref:Magnesium transporter MgtE n=1 Tax=Propioniferax innocua TaxID=1753 RepID=A0A542ZSL3_9ACTN|nr:magnesium transporter [Propioniferax innocua]TQL63328.1 magnesium transporter [Propioniferax innocua]
MDNQIGNLHNAVSMRDARQTSTLAAQCDVRTLIDRFERFSGEDRAFAFRLLSKDRALMVFEGLDPALRSDLVKSLRHEEIAEHFEQMDPDDRVALIDELPAKVASRLLSGLSPEERALTARVAGYPLRSVGRRMSPEPVLLTEFMTADEALAQVRRHLEAETVYTLPVLDGQRGLVGVTSLRRVLASESSQTMSDVMDEPIFARAEEDAELVARRCADQGLLAMPIVDSEKRLVGILTIDDAHTILEEAESEDQARASASEPLRRPYLSTPVTSLVRSRIVWLLALALGATLTVQVLDSFEDTLEQMVVLALFVPLLIGTGGNTGNQAATTVTRALALGDAHPQDVGRIAIREAAVGVLLGFILGGLGCLLAGMVFEWRIGLVIGLTLLCICTLAATVGGLMPLAAKAIGADPAVFSNPFITTFVDAAGLVIYFLIAAAVFGL